MRKIAREDCTASQGGSCMTQAEEPRPPETYPAGTLHLRRGKLGHMAAAAAAHVVGATADVCFQASMAATAAEHIVQWSK